MKHLKTITTTLALGLSLFAVSGNIKVHASTEYWYNVQKGESYYSISKRFGIDVSEFDVDKTLKADTKIIIPGFVLEPHKVVKGDTIHSLAKANNVEESLILMANDMKEDDKIILDHYLLIPTKDPEKDSEKVTDGKSDVITPIGGKTEDEKSGKLQGDSQEKIEETVPSELGKKETADKVEEKNEVVSGEYIIQKGDSLMSISRKMNIPVKDILSWNPSIKNPNMIYAGKKIKISATSDNKNSSETVKTDVQTVEYDFSGLSSMISHYKGMYPGLRIGLGIYSLSEGRYIYQNNVNQAISSACTVKAAYAAYVLRKCTENGYDLDSTMIMYRDYMMNSGSGRLKNFEVNQEFSVRVLLTYMLEVSDNTAYNVLLSKFDLKGFQDFLNQYDGQSLNGCRYGSCSVRERMNEWLMIMNYCNSTDPNGQVLYDLLKIAKYSYLAQGFDSWHNYVHKSGWADGVSYNSCSDSIVVNNKYVIVVISDDYNACIAHTDVVRNIGSWCDNYLF